ncbi:hypothetical protein [Streptomyces sp. NPDC093105]|uniref:hypothetical protein n=1 Tax=Streptomyces sp. NPDC093105 TaxID=3366029 RepID=UPI0038179E6B
MYVVVGQAAALRSGAQTAADAAALGAAEDARDQLRDGWLDVIGDPAQWSGLLQGDGYVIERACQRAIALASLNKAELKSQDCVPQDLGFTVTVQTERTVGNSIVPDTSERRATATASAVVEPLCTFEPPEPPESPSPPPSPEPPTEPDPSATPSEEPEEEDPVPISGLSCGGEDWEINPDDPVLPPVEDLFRVRLTGDDE